MSIPTAPPAPLIDALRDRYTVERELGRGGMATVYLARDLRHDRLVALKVLRPGMAYCDAELLRLRGELLAAFGAPTAEVRRVLQEAIDTAARQGATAFVRRAEHSLQRPCV